MDQSHDARLLDAAAEAGAVIPTGNSLRDAQMAEHQFDAIMDMMVLVESYAVSAREAAYRRDKKTADVHLTQLRLCIIAARDTLKDIKNGGKK